MNEWQSKFRRSFTSKNGTLNGDKKVRCQGYTLKRLWNYYAIIGAHHLFFTITQEIVMTSLWFINTFVVGGFPSNIIWIIIKEIGWYFYTLVNTHTYSLTHKHTHIHKYTHIHTHTHTYTLLFYCYKWEIVIISLLYIFTGMFQISWCMVIFYTRLHQSICW